MSFNIIPVATGYKEIHPYIAMNIDSAKINTSLIMMREWLSLTALYPSCWCSGQQKGGRKGQGEGQQAASYTYRLILDSEKITYITFFSQHSEHSFPSEQCNLSWLGCCGWLLAVQTFRFWRSPLLPSIVSNLRGTWHSSWAGLFMLMNQTLSKSHFHFFSFPSGRNLVRRATAGAYNVQSYI